MIKFYSKVALFTLSLTFLFIGCAEPFAPGEGDVTPPFITGASPEDGAENVPIDSEIEITFSEEIDEATINRFSIRVICEEKTVEGELKNSAKSKTVTFAPSNALKEGRIYTVYLSRSLTDSAGIPLDVDGKDSIYSFSFETAFTRPEVTETSPVDESENVETTIEAVSITFSEAMNDITINPSTLLLYDLEAEISYEEESFTVFLTPTSQLEPLKEYVITVTGQVEDSDGINMEENYVLRFATGSE